jgi:hypothetical protein
MDPVEAHPHGSTVYRVVANKRAVTFLPLALHRRVKASGPPARGPPDSPNSPPGVVKSKRETFERLLSRRRIGPHPVDVTESIKDGVCLGTGAELDPLLAVRVCEVHQSAVVNMPASEDEIKIGSAIGWKRVGLHVARQ